MAYNPLNPNGQATMANSQPVVIASNQTPVSVAGTINLGTQSGSVVAFQGTSPWITRGSVSGTVGASVVGHAPVVIVGGSVAASFTPPANQSVSGTVGASIIGTVPVTFVNSSISGTVNVGNFPTNQNVSGSVVAVQGTTPWLIGSVYGNISGSVAATITNANVNVSGSVVGFQGGTWAVNATLVAPSIVGTYSEDATHTTADKGLFVLGVRNDAVASFASANLEYGPMGTDAAGRALTKPFAPEESRVEGYNSVVSTSVTTLVAAAGAGLRNYITDIVLANTGTATTLVTFRSGGGTSVLGYGIAPTGGGSNMIGFATPIRTLANETFDIQATTSTSVLYATVKGFKAP